MLWQGVFLPSNCTVKKIFEVTVLKDVDQTIKDHSALGSQGHLESNVVDAESSFHVLVMPVLLIYFLHGINLDWSLQTLAKQTKVDTTHSVQQVPPLKPQLNLQRLRAFVVSGKIEREVGCCANCNFCIFSMCERTSVFSKRCHPQELEFSSIDVTVSTLLLKTWIVVLTLTAYFQVRR